ncbi:hypothetical protein [Syntrophotalea acetylenica]|uniref:Uncharacterized protein n=1 Tax=Syntrophotalea acetylenica TaxID=29542 RepID=A0A1L3GDQ9_SYNAC|nr:hypothetical protein [Syntrophotalea acetylenica]APG24086.1 hypothetical protein A7E75_02860 [Syntrophotalea acetylenica]APG44668.1 hypothetical protein A6070_11485 [Syntrophotalea acetylenica]
MNKHNDPTMAANMLERVEATQTALRKIIATLVDLMERSDMEEFGEACQPVTNGEWFGAIEEAKAVIASAPKTKKIGFRCIYCGQEFSTVEACNVCEKSHL